jgi:hypothetical protein
MFSLLIFFKGYTADMDDNLHVRYDVQVYDPMGNPTEDRGTDIEAYKGPKGNADSLMLNQTYLKIIFTDKYPAGTYKIKVTAYDKVSNESFTSETPIELVPFSLPVKIFSEQEIGEWVMGYYAEPTPVKAVSIFQQLVQLDSEWLNDNLNILTFFRRIFSDNPFLLQNIAKSFGSFSLEDKKKFLLIAAISGDTSLESIITVREGDELWEYFSSINDIELPGTNGEINTAVQLDILWSEFLTTGKYAPIRKIVSALALEKYKGTLEKIKSGEIENVTEEIKSQAYLEATHQSAIWSLISNSKQIPLVFKYCQFIYENEELDEDIKNQLGSILRIAYKEIQEEKEEGESK